MRSSVNRTSSSKRVVMLIATYVIAAVVCIAASTNNNNQQNTGFGFPGDEDEDKGQRNSMVISLFVTFLIYY